MAGFDEKSVGLETAYPTRVKVPADGVSRRIEKYPVEHDHLLGEGHARPAGAHVCR